MKKLLLTLSILLVFPALSIASTQADVDAFVASYEGSGDCVAIVDTVDNVATVYERCGGSTTVVSVVHTLDAFQYNGVYRSSGFACDGTYNRLKNYVTTWHQGDRISQVTTYCDGSSRTYVQGTNGHVKASRGSCNLRNSQYDVDCGQYDTLVQSFTIDGLPDNNGDTGSSSDDTTASLPIGFTNSLSCPIPIASSVDVTDGNLIHDQALFDGLTLYYNTIDPIEGSLPKYWSHSYDLILKEYSNGGVAFREADGYGRVYEPSGGGYESSRGDYSTLSKDSDNSFIITEKNGAFYSFNQDNKIESFTDLNGNVTAFGYDDGNMVSVVSPSGKEIIFGYDSDGQLLTVTDTSGNDYLFAYDGEANLIEVSYPAVDSTVPSWSYSYDDEGYMLTKVDPDNYTVTYSYDEEGSVVSASTSEGEEYALSYDAGNNTTQMTRPDGGVWSFSYDKETDALLTETDPSGGITSYTYDSDLNVTSKESPDDSTASYTYDEYGNRISETDAAGSTTSYTYNQYGQVLTVTDAEGNASAYEYDDKGNLSSTTDASGVSTSYEYDAKGNVTKITDSTGGETVMSYDDSNNLTSVTDASGATTSFEYDAAGNMTSQTDASGNKTTFEYNSLNQLIKVTDPQGKATSYSYDRSGNRTAQADANGNITYYEYNHKGQVIKVTDALGGETKYTYGGTSCSACGSKGDNLTSITDAKGNTTKFEYDHLSRLVKEVGPLGQSTGYSYDAKGSLASKTDAEGNTINYSYDALGRLLGKNYPDNTGESYSYDIKGNLLTAANGNIGYTFTYDAGNRVTSVTDSTGRAISYSYDTSGRKTKMSGPNGEEIDYSYDESKRLSTIASDAGDFIFTYDSLGRRVGLSYPHGVTASYSYDASGRLTDLIHSTSGGSVIASNSYSHDNVGNRLTNESNTRTAVYQYDDIYRLNEANYTTPGFSTTKNDKGKGKNKGLSNAIANQTEVYTYDPVGNRLTSEKSNVYTYNKANQIESFSGTTYSYDKNGNLAYKVDGDESSNYSYDYENRLIRVDKQEGDKTIVVTFKYDPFGRRLEKNVVKDGVTTTNKYFYDNEDILFEYDENGNIGNRYIHGPGIDEPLALIQKKGYYYYHTDGLGSIVALTDENQKVVQTYDYGYFGQLKNQKNRIKQPYKYTGREWDKEIGLYFYRARYYDADLGRFTQKDPVGFRGGINHFAYVGGNPSNLIDPSGLAWYDNWHYEWRDARNINLPGSPDQALDVRGRILLPEKMSLYHQNGGKPEQKLIFPDGREAVYDGDTNQLVTDSQFKGTYNYVNPAVLSWNPLKWPSIAVRGMGHFVADMLPYYIWGNERPFNIASELCK